MKHTFRAALAFLVLSLAGVAHAEGDYYEGVQKEPAAVRHVSKSANALEPAVGDSGDYYEGASRPN
ncbi:hypothetical protein [Rhizobium leguminosarum]|uniref:hypothetical protein n=1 Tax=Rhizobium leguminosarum TaxID=384 RepID=UPI002E10AA1F|nr:hypothetical protein U8Q02_43645 [Rhizobium leguminosarum]